MDGWTRYILLVRNKKQQQQPKMEIRKKLTVRNLVSNKIQYLIKIAKKPDQKLMRVQGDTGDLWVLNTKSRRNQLEQDSLGGGDGAGK